jgi:response regulator RpfG family c-di-GMP phosphodiesterase
VTSLKESNISEDVPIFITTAFDETKYLWEAIRLGVTQYISKPIDSIRFTKLILQSAQNILQKRELKQAQEDLLKAREQEIELLAYREKYHSIQQENAFKKQLKIIKENYNYILR